jgi:hypothetical protein
MSNESILLALEAMNKALQSHNETFTKMFSAMEKQQEHIAFLYGVVSEISQRLVLLEGNNEKTVCH